MWECGRPTIAFAWRLGNRVNTELIREQRPQVRAGRSAFASRDSRWVTTDETMPTADTVIRAPLLRSTGLAFPVVARNCPVAMDHMGGGDKGKGKESHDQRQQQNNNRMAGGDD